MSTAPRAIPESPTAAAGLPDWLDLTLVSRRPARLPEATLAAAMDLLVPTAAPARRSATGAPPIASIVVVTHNNLAFTKLCLTSLLGNTDAPDYELIVVDNGSADGTPDYLRSVAGAHRHVRVISNDANRGFAPANNQGLAVARGRVLVLLNNDTVVPPGWLAGLCRHLGDPTIGLAGPVTNRIGNEAEVAAEYRTYANFLRAAANRAADRAARPFDIPRPAMFCLALRRDAYAKVGPLDERFEVGLFEDDDYAMRARAAGYRVTCAEDVLVHHFGEASFGALFEAGRHAEVFRANRRRFEEKWGVVWHPPRSRADTSGAAAGRARVADAVAAAVPRGARVAVVSKGDDALFEAMAARGVRPSHFPGSPDGTYAGFHPADGPEAIGLAAAAHARGDEYLVVPAASAWWLSHYVGLWGHLGGSPVDRSEACTIFRLRATTRTAGHASARGLT